MSDEILAGLDVMRRRFAELIVEANDRGMNARVTRYSNWDEIAAAAQGEIERLTKQLVKARSFLEGLDDGQIEDCDCPDCSRVRAIRDFMTETDDLRGQE